MGYTINYGPKPNKKHPVFRGWAWVLVLLLAAGLWMPRSRERILALRDSLIPGTALEAFAGELRQGHPLDSAVLAFCQEIVNEAKNTVGD